jgi:hypothetical protein
MPGLLGNKLPSFKIGKCKGCADCDAGKVSKRSHKRREKRMVTQEMLDELDRMFLGMGLTIKPHDRQIIAGWMEEGKLPFKFTREDERIVGVEII